jgi:short-subunit dehydrogenase
VGYPGAAGYAASKDGLAAYARSLSVALAGQHIHVLTVFPGPTRTAHARRYSPDNRREQRRMPPEQLAAQIMQAIARRQSRLIPGASNRFFALLGSYLPGLVDGIMRKTLLEPLEKRKTQDETHQS